MATGLERTYAAISSLRQASTQHEICERLTGFTGLFGLTSVLAGTNPSGADDGDNNASHAFAWSYPREWMTRYIEQGYSRIDPVINRISHDLKPFRWGDARRYCDADDAETVMLEAAEFGLKDGLVIPLLTLEGSVAAVSLGGEYVDIPPNGFGHLTLVASYAMARAIELREVESRRIEVGLTPREIECLKWVADGKSEWEIGTILSISEHTADKHLSNARRKLRAVSGAQAVAQALRLGLLP